MSKKANAKALLPILVFLALYLGLGILFEYVMKIPMGFYNIPIVVVFLAALAVACLQNKDVSFEDKINVIYGHNEAGKSTMHAYIRAMLFGIKRAKGVAAQTDIWSHYKPWKSQKYGGTLRIEDGGHIYKLTRDFYEAPMDVSVYDETAGVEVENPDEWLSGVLCNMTIKSYDNTISIGQLKSSTDASMAEEIKEKNLIDLVKALPEYNHVKFRQAELHPYMYKLIIK